MTKHTDSSRLIDSGVSGNAQTRARKIRAQEWFRSKAVTQLRWKLADRYEYSAEDAECNLLAAFAQTECSRLASRVEELEKDNAGLRSRIDERCEVLTQIALMVKPAQGQALQRRIYELVKLAGAHAEEKE